MKSTLSEWIEFKESSIYADMIEEINARKEFITDKLIAGNDAVWSDSEMRGRLNELEFIRTMVKDNIAILELDKANKEKEEKNKGSFINGLIDGLKSLSEGDDR